MRRAGQLFTTDFIVSLVLFMSALGTIFYGVGAALDQQAAQNRNAVLQQRASQLTDLLIRTPGYPQGWNASTIAVPGLAPQDHIIDPGRFIGLRRAGVERIEELARLGTAQLRIELTVNGSGVSIGGFTGQDVAVVTDRQLLFTQLEHSGADWDLYWIGAGPPSAPDAGTVHSDPSAATMMEAALSNRSGYDAIVADSTGLNVTDVDGIDRLPAFVAEGGRYLQVGGGDLVTAVTGTAVPDPPTTGTVTDARWLDPALTAGDSVELSRAPLALSGVQAAVNTTGGDCLVCVTDGVLFTAAWRLTAASASSNGMDSRRLLTTFIFGTNGTIGAQPAPGATEIVPRERPVLIDGKRLRRGQLEVIVWR